MTSLPWNLPRRSEIAEICIKILWHAIDPGMVHAAEARLSQGVYRQVVSNIWTKTHLSYRQGWDLFTVSCSEFSAGLINFSQFCTWWSGRSASGLRQGNTRFLPQNFAAVNGSTPSGSRKISSVVFSTDDVGVHQSCVFLALCCSSHVISTCSLDSKRDVNQHTASSKSSDTCVYQGVNESYLGSPWQLDAKKKWFLRRCGKLFCFECCYFLHQVHSHFKPRVIYFFKLVKWSLKVDGMV